STEVRNNIGASVRGKMRRTGVSALLSIHSSKYRNFLRSLLGQAFRTEGAPQGKRDHRAHLRKPASSAVDLLLDTKKSSITSDLQIEFPLFTGWEVLHPQFQIAKFGDDHIDTHGNGFSRGMAL